MFADVSSVDHHKLKFGLVVWALTGNLVAGAATPRGPDEDSILDPWLQTSQPVRGAVGPHWNLPARTIRRAET